MDAGVRVTKGEVEVVEEEVEAGEEEEESSLPYGLGEMMDKGLWNSGVKEEMEEEEQMWKVEVEEVVMKGVVAVEELMEDQG